MKTKKTLDVYFDLTSPYSYIAAELIEEIAAAGQRHIHYKPTLLGLVFKETGNSSPRSIPSKGTYTSNDFQRTVRFYNLKLNWPKQFPINGACANQAILKLNDQAPAETGHFVRALYHAYFVHGQDITTSECIAKVANTLGLNGADLASAADDPVYQEKCQLAVRESLAVGMFGAPYFVVDGEAFWGHDRMDQLKRWVVDGPF